MNVHAAWSVKCHLVKQEYWCGMAVLHRRMHRWQMFSTIRWKLVSHPPPAWNIAPACNSPLQRYLLLRIWTSWTLNFGAHAIEEICWVAEAVCCCKMLNFTVYIQQDQSQTSVPWRIHVVNPPDLTFRGFYHQEGARFIVDGSHLAQLELHSTFVGSKDRLNPYVVVPKRI